MLRKSACIGSFRLEREQRHVACALDGLVENPLVLSADTSHASWNDLACVSHIFSKQFDILVIDIMNFIDRKRANLAPEKPARTAASTHAATASALTTPPSTTPRPSIRPFSRPR